MKLEYRVLVSVLTSSLMAACVPEPVVELFTADDMRPPAVASWGPSCQDEVIVLFDEDIESALPGFAASPGPAVSAVRVGDDGSSVVVTLDSSQMPGVAYALSGVVADASGNLSSFVLPYWGYNPDPPAMLINELLTEGSSTHPDAVEFCVVRGGLCAGLAFFVGSPVNYDARYVFPALLVEAGDYVILHLKPQGIAVEVDEFEDMAASGGLDSKPGAWDLWYRGEGGALSGKNGALALCSSPGGAIIDAVLYSERSIDSDTKYGGFGTAALRDKVDDLVAAGCWEASEPPRPEDCARSTGTTSTRTICRSSDSADNDTGADWHIVPTSGSTLGAANSDAVHTP